MFRRLKIFFNISINKHYESNREIDFQYLEKVNESSKRTKSTLDLITWNDMNMNKIFSKINFTSSSPGEEKLYTWLRNPLDRIDTFKKRLALIQKFEMESEKVEELSKALRNIGFNQYHLIEVMKSKYESKVKLLAIHSLLALTNLFLFFQLIVNGISLLSLFLLVLFPINIYLHYNFNQNYGCQLEVLQYSIKLLRFCKQFESDITEINPEISLELQTLLEKLKPISKKEMIIFRMEGFDLFADYINITFLLKEINYFSIAGVVQDLAKDIVRLYNIVGELDAIISIVKYRNSLSYYSEPKIIRDTEKIDLKEVYHPLLDNPISNTIEIEKDIAITGSNMSGKSTFLRTIGINIIFSQSICTSLAKKYVSRFYRIITSISLNDAILESKSFFLMEAEAIKRMLDVKDNEYPTIMLIDEIFKGTNPIERYAASMEILNDLGSGHTKVIVATHDLNILPELHGYDFHYFTENISSHGIKFNYKIHSGITKTRNAIKILQYVKYPNKLVDKINYRIETILAPSVAESKIN